MMDIWTNEQTGHEDLRFELECPTCDCHAVFDYVGIQRFPEVVAQQLGLPAEIHLWSCGSCQTTLSHVDLGIVL